MAYGHTPLRIVRQHGKTYLGGGCNEFGCDHSFIEHDNGTVAAGGQCRGTVDPFGNGSMTRPCECLKFRPNYHG